MNCNLTYDTDFEKTVMLLKYLKFRKCKAGAAK